MGKVKSFPPWWVSSQEETGSGALNGWREAGKQQKRNVDAKHHSAAFRTVEVHQSANTSGDDEDDRFSLSNQDDSPSDQHTDGLSAPRMEVRQRLSRPEDGEKNPTNIKTLGFQIKRKILKTFPKNRIWETNECVQKCLEAKQQVARVLQLFALVLIVPRRPAVLVSEAPEDVHVSCVENLVAEFVKKMISLGRSARSRISAQYSSWSSHLSNAVY